ncbi:MAG: ribonucleoside-diphosphate reductase, adenosylcobalamin-dependent [Leptothrix sp. (in: Bacteria)]|nr:ribonucleoside-diphosphate reductase, adenosylcobalamin-dependent [Leptothrix sp. (in: b-proteobacteria)]
MGARPVSPPDQALSRDVLLERYALPQEQEADDVRRRIAGALAGAEAEVNRPAWTARFLAAQRAGFLPAGRIAAQAGSGGQATWLNCFVLPIAATAQADAEAITTALAETVQTLGRGGGVGLDFTPVHPQGAAAVAAAGGDAAGPVAALGRFDAACRALDRTGVRPGALMGVLRCDHPDIEAFARCKAHGGLSHFNLSVGVTEDFMRAVQAAGEVDLVHDAWPGAAQRAAGAWLRDDGRWVYRRVPARQVWDAIVSSAHARGDPGLLFLDRINADNNLAWCETLAAANPCGEQPLPPYGACCLGSFDLTRFVTAPFTAQAHLDLKALASWVPVAVRMLDDVLELSPWPLPQQRRQALATRRIGLGCTGLGDALVMLGLHYDSDTARAQAVNAVRCLRDMAYAASAALAVERGAFPAFDAGGLLRPGTFASRLPQPLQARIHECGLRNSHLLSIAPAGSISLAFADNVSSGIEPVFAWQGRRLRPGGRGLAHSVVEDAAVRLFRRLRGPGAPLPRAFVLAQQLTPVQHLAMVAAVAPYVDGAISKTVNTPAGSTVADFDALFRQAWQLRLKGVTAFRPGCGAGAVLLPWPAAAAADPLRPAHAASCR